jgi:hypothetical protein
MKQRFGALLCVALGAVLITTGLAAGTDAAAGLSQPTCQVPIGAALSCPTGTITVTETTVNPADGTVPPGGWIVHVTSTTCTRPNGSAVNETLTIADGSHDKTGQLFAFADPGHATSCTYVLTEEPVAGATAVFDPAPPVTIPFSVDIANRNVALTNTFAPPSTTVTPTPTTSAPSTDTGSPSVSLSSTAIIDTVTAVSATPIANTGPHEQIRSSVYIGIALCLLGFALLCAGTVQRRRGRHTT